LNVWFILLGVGLLFVVFYYFLGKKFGIREGATVPDIENRISKLEHAVGILMMKKGKELKSPERRGGVNTKKKFGKKRNEGKGVTHPITIGTTDEEDYDDDDDDDEEDYDDDDDDEEGGGLGV
jgi:hypothetical protein